MFKMFKSFHEVSKQTGYKGLSKGGIQEEKAGPEKLRATQANKAIPKSFGHSVRSLHSRATHCEHLECAAQVIWHAVRRCLRAA